MTLRFPISMLNGPANEKLLRSEAMPLDVELVDDADITPDLEQAAREWLAAAMLTYAQRDTPETRAVREALERLEERR